MLIALIILAWLLVNTWLTLVILVKEGCIIENEEVFYIAIGALLSPFILALIERILDKLHK